MTRTKDLQFVRSQTFCGDHRPTKSLLESVQRSARGAAQAGGGGRGGGSHASESTSPSPRWTGGIQKARGETRERRGGHGQAPATNARG